MRTTLNSILAILVTCCNYALAAVGGEGAAYAPPPRVSVVWVWVFAAVFVGICVWIGVAVWRAEMKERARASGDTKAQPIAPESQQNAN